ncbi:DUF2637 domain-containing protein [Streptosporangium saharense]|uniref:DUF2637 domain-containing protein n=1 Tax=Streptosporangium saharense TaxID=1706840 RepID=A0A7W7QHP2_9ACTN|nr:DUF2637 domain-containing protein [Streptosporangium saharense]MBB4913795.1 hypothetical protein [Streptosporangium saharense]
MDVKSPAAAGIASRPSSIPPAQQSRTAIVLRRTGIALVGVGVAALAAAACVLSFEDLRALAITGEAPVGLAYLYPAAFDALLAVALISVLLLRGARWPIRLQAGVVLTLLLAGAVAAETATAVRATVDVRRAAVVVAVFPWVALLLALWLWLLLINHAAARRASADTAAAGRTADIVPFPEGDLPTAEYPVPLPRPAHQEYSGRHEEPVHHQPSEVVLDPQAAPPLEPAPRHAPPAAPVTVPVSEPVVGPTAAPETPEVTELPAPRAEAEPEPEREPDRPLRWGDLVRPHHGDLLVHPPRSAVQDASDEPEEPEGRVSERVETWEAEQRSPEEPAEKAEEKDAEEDPGEDTQPMAVATDEPAKRSGETDKADDAAPSGRMRSTPVPPEKGEE